MRPMGGTLGWRVVGRKNLSPSTLHGRSYVRRGLTAPARGSAVGEFAQRPTEPVGHPGHVGPGPTGLRPSGELPRTSTRRSRNLAKKATPLEPIINRPWIPERRQTPLQLQNADARHRHAPR